MLLHLQVTTSVVNEVSFDHRALTVMPLCLVVVMLLYCMVNVLALRVGTVWCLELVAVPVFFGGRLFFFRRTNC